MCTLLNQLSSGGHHYAAGRQLPARNHSLRIAAADSSNN
jgi:hypothetical protein